ncbi:MAG: molybdenum cofactor guanylyltransferase [Flavobacteriales bacterium]|nr:molybdenum cofactor guanylyltransferase [Flavobacteriales bacterium]
MEKIIQTYILCGGKSTRMESEKGLVMLHDKTFIERILEQTSKVSKNITLVTSNKEYQKFGFPLVSDIHKNKGALGGIYTALHHTTEYKILILSCDIPFITSTILQDLIEFNEKTEAEISIAKDNKNIHPLIGVYTKRCEEKCEKLIQLDELRVMNFINQFNTNYLDVKPEDSHLLENINSKKELNKHTK